MSTSETSSRLGELARRQLDDYDARRPGSIFASNVTMTVEEAYRLQNAVSALRVERGERVVGYKVGCTSTTIRRQLGIDHCVTGRLYEGERFSSGARLRRDGFANLAIEGELAVTLAREPVDNDFREEDRVPTCVARVLPVIELHHKVFRGNTPSAGELIANNAIHAGFVCGDGGASDAAGAASLNISVNRRVVASCSGESLTRTIHTSLRWLAQVMRERGETLHSGQVVLTGSIPPLIAIDEPCRVDVVAPPFGTVATDFE